MKAILLFIAILSGTVGQVSITDPVALFTLSDAEKILGEPAHLTDSASTVKGASTEFTCAYTANAKDAKSGKTGTVYFLIEDFRQASAAIDKYSTIRTANANHAGVKVLHDVGDEAYFHSDGENFYFIMVRKGNRVFNMKVNKVTKSTSLDQFNRIAKHITDSL